MQHSNRLNDVRHQTDLRLGARETLGLSPYSWSRTGLDGGIQTTAAWSTTDIAMVPSGWCYRLDRTEAEDMQTAWAKMVRAGSELPAAAAGASSCCCIASPTGPPRLEDHET
jgi:hypothetical protein